MKLEETVEDNLKIIFDILDDFQNVCYKIRGHYKYFGRSEYEKEITFDGGTLTVYNSPKNQYVEFVQSNQLNPIPAGKMYWKNIDKIYIQDIHLVFENFNHNTIYIPIIKIYLNNYNEDYNCYTNSEV